MSDNKTDMLLFIQVAGESIPAGMEDFCDDMVDDMLMSIANGDQMYGFKVELLNGDTVVILKNDYYFKFFYGSSSFTDVRYPDYTSLKRVEPRIKEIVVYD